MTGSAEAIAHGAATIVNAIATGKGAAFGVDLWTKAKVSITNEPNVIESEIGSEPSEDKTLIEKSVNRVFKHFKVEKQFGAKVKTSSNIPIARGLKSSSAAANAVVLATAASLGKSLQDLDAINLGVDAAYDAKVTLTGAFDDACASFFGGIVITDNLKRKLKACASFAESFSVLFHVPPKKAYTSETNMDKLKVISPLVKIAYQEATKGNTWTALSLNGLIYSSALGFDPSVALDALNAGAMAAGLCGKGPAVTVVVSEDNFEQVKAILHNYEGKIISAKLNRDKAKMVT